jgi:hypothetical protein
MAWCLIKHRDNVTFYLRIGKKINKDRRKVRKKERKKEGKIRTKKEEYNCRLITDYSDNYLLNVKYLIRLKLLSVESLNTELF